MDYQSARSALDGDLYRLRDTVHCLSEHLRKDLNLPDVASSFETRVSAMGRKVGEIMGLPSRDVGPLCESVEGDANHLRNDIEQKMEKVLGPMSKSKHVEIESRADYLLYLRGIGTEIVRALWHVIPEIRQSISQAVQDIFNPSKGKNAPARTESQESHAEPPQSKREIPEHWLCPTCHYHIKGLPEKRRCHACKQLSFKEEVVCKQCGGTLADLLWVTCPECASEIALQVRISQAVMKPAIQAARTFAGSAQKLLAAAKAEHKE